MRTLAATIAAFALPTLVQALNQDGTLKYPPVNLDKACYHWQLNSADVDYGSAEGMDKYSFFVLCDLKYGSSLDSFGAQIQAEWFEKMHRASEKVTAFGETFTTWATCNKDPFVDGSASCSNQGMGAHKWAAYFGPDQAPFAQGKTTKAAAQAKSPAKTPTPRPAPRIVIDKPLGTFPPRATGSPSPGGSPTSTSTPSPTNSPSPTSSPTSQATANPNEQPPTIVSPTQNQVLPAGGQMLIKIQPAMGSNVTKFNVELQKKVGGVWQAWTSLTYDSQASPNGVWQQTGAQNPDRRLRAKAQGPANAQWTAWVNFKLQ